MNLCFKGIRVILLCCIGVANILFVGCLKDDPATIALPTKIGEIPASVIPQEMQEQLAKHMHLYNGTNPPNIEGCYRVSPFTPIYASDGYADDSFHDMILDVKTQSERSLIEFSDQQQSATIQTSSARILGQDPYFTLYDQVLVTDTERGFLYYATIVISGTASSGGIKDLQYAIIMGKQAGYSWQLASTGSWRVFCDGDGFSPKQ